MPQRAEVVVTLDPAGRSAVVRVAGPLDHGSAPVVRQLVRRAVAVAGPWVTVDLSRCTGLAPSVAGCLVEEDERLRARGGALVCEGAPPPVPGQAPAVLPSARRPSRPAGDDGVALLRRAVRRRLHADDEEGRRAAGRRLLALLREQQQGASAVGPDRPAGGSTWNTGGPSLVEDRHEHP